MAIINLLSSPRNISTALMYSFAQRKDMKVVDEPFYSFYLWETDANHPGKSSIIKSQSPDYDEVILENNLLASKQDHLFLKNMAHHMIDPDFSWMLGDVKNVFLLRDPKQLIASFAQVITSPKMSDIGIQKQVELYQYLKENGNNPILLDSSWILNDPKKILQKLCTLLEIPFDENMLSWKKGPKREDIIWAKYWYKNVRGSTGFEKQATSSREFPKNLTNLLEASLPLYESLLSAAETQFK